ncbi:MAG: glycerol kinase GlpK [Clostridiales bacterium]|nr:glycerol kinase GlpK [Clostridiales bacterium]
MSRYVLALDQGTTSSRAILFDGRGNVVAVENKEFRQIYPQPGWVEHDPEEIWESQLHVAQAVLQKAGIKGDEVAAIGVTNQRETTILWDKRTGKPVHNAIVWQDRRTAGFCQELKDKGYEPLFRERTGLVLDPYFSGTKIRWLLDHVEGLRERAEKGEIAFGTVDSWLLFRLTGGKVHATDPSNASRTLLMDLGKVDWDDELLSILGVPRAILPKILPSSGVFGETDPALFGAAIPVAGMAGDQQAALFGQACYRPGMAKNTYGTGAFLLLNTGEKKVSSQKGLLTTVAWQLGEKVTYALEGSIFIAGAVIQWLRDELKILRDAAESEALAREVPDTGGVYLVPAFTGLGAPYWDPYARGILVGLTRGTNRSHVVRAALEAVAYQSRDVLAVMQEEAGLSLDALRVDGGAVQNDFLMQFQADILGTRVDRPKVHETTALGAAYLAGLAVGFWKDTEAIEGLWQRDRTFEPSMKEEEREARYQGWKRAVERALGWARE